MKIAAIIPSRYQSTRFEGKPLALISGTTMIERVYRRVEQCGKFSRVIVATDDKRIADAVSDFGGHFQYTSPDHSSGSERIWEVLENSDFDAAINIQGDEPIVPPGLISLLYDQLASGKYPVVTPAYFNTSYDDYCSRHVVKVVVAQDFQGLYFSRAPIPFMDIDNFSGFFQHIGLYGYLKGALESFVKLPKSNLEKAEKLEQLRFLDNGIPIRVIRSEYPSYGVDVPSDVGKIEEMLKQREENDQI